MARYSALSDYLRAQKRNNVPMTFDQIERLIGRKLPASHRYRSRWSNNSFNSVMTRAWLDAGFEAANVNMKARKLLFRRSHPKAQISTDEATEAAGRPAISKRHPLYGALRGLARVAP